MTVKLLIARNGIPAGAKVSLGWAEEERLVRIGEAASDISSAFNWPIQSDMLSIGPIPDEFTLQAAYPAETTLNAVASVGASPPYVFYVSDGSAWVTLVGEGVEEEAVASLSDHSPIVLLSTRIQLLP